MTARMTCGMRVKATRPFKNACTATSLAAFSTAGMVPPRRAAPDRSGLRVFTPAAAALQDLGAQEFEPSVRDGLVQGVVVVDLVEHHPLR